MNTNTKKTLGVITIALAIFIIFDLNITMNSVFSTVGLGDGYLTADTFTLPTTMEGNCTFTQTTTAGTGPLDSCLNTYTHTCADNNYLVTGHDRSCSNPSGYSTPQTVNDALKLQAGAAGTGTNAPSGDKSFTWKRNIKGQNIKAKIDYTLYGGSTLQAYYAGIKIGSETIPNPSGNTFGTPTTGSKIIETTVSTLNPNKVMITYGGIISDINNDGVGNESDILDVTLANSVNLRIDFKSSGATFDEDLIQSIINIDYLKYEIPFESCILGPNELLAKETFVGPKELHIIPDNTFRFPVKRFCLDTPVIIATSQGIDATAEPYQVWKTGGSIGPSSGQTWEVSYVFDNSQNLVITSCNIGEILDVESLTCETKGGIVSLCSTGIFDPTIGACTADINSTQVCANGRLDLGTLTCIYNPPVQEVCTEGTYNNATQTCTTKLVVSQICPEEMTWDPTQLRCTGRSEIPGIQPITTQDGQVITQQTQFEKILPLLIILLLIILGTLLVFGDRTFGNISIYRKGKTFLQRNKEGTFIGLAIGLITAFIYTGGKLAFLNNIIPTGSSTLTVYTLLAVIGAMTGLIIDALYKWRK